MPPKKCLTIFFYSLFFVFGQSSGATSWEALSFPILAWNIPNIAILNDTLYQDMADVGLTGNIGWNFTPPSRADNLRMLSMAKKAGLKMLIADARITSPKPFLRNNPVKPLDSAAIDSAIADYKDSSAFLGYFIWDEPHSSQFSDLGKIQEYLNRKDPDHLTYNNLLPNYADLNSQLGSSSYKAHVDDYIRLVKPQVLSYDNYPILADLSLRPGFYENLEIIRKAAMANSIPFWAFICSFTDFRYAMPTEGCMRFQLYSDLVYGAKGVQYFPYAQGYTLSPLNADGSKTPIWYSIQKINREFMPLAPLMKRLTSTAVHHSAPLPTGTSGFSLDFPVTSASTPLVAGTFRDTNNTQYLMLVNRDYINGKNILITVSDSVDSLVEVSKANGSELPGLANRGDSLELQFMAGEGRLFRIATTDSAKTYLKITIALMDSITHQKVTTLAFAQLFRSAVEMDSSSSRTGTLKLFGNSTGDHTLNISTAGYLSKSNIPILLSVNDTSLVVQCTRQPLVGIDVQPDVMSMTQNSRQQLQIYGIYTDQTTLLLENSAVPQWTSRSPEVVSVNDSGLLVSNTLKGGCYIVAGIVSLGLSDSIEVHVIDTLKLKNPGFESPAIATYQYNPTDSGWSFIGQSGIEHNGSLFGATNAPEGVQAAFLQRLGMVSQPLFLDGGYYKIKGKAAQRASNATTQTIKVYIDSLEIGSYTPQTTSFQEFVTLPAFASKGTHLLKFAGTNNSGDNTAFLDAVGIEISNTTDHELSSMRLENLSLAASPNPFNPNMTIQISGWKTGSELKILNVNGRVVADFTSALNTSANGDKFRQVTWNASGYASGVYLITLKHGRTELKCKAMLIR